MTKLTKKIEELIQNNFTETHSENPIPLDETELVDENLFTDWDPDANPVVISPHEENQSPSALISGVTIPQGDFDETFGDYNYASIDGSSGRIIRQTMAAIFVRSALGTESKRGELPLTEIIDEEAYVLVTSNYFLKAKASKNNHILKMNPERTITGNVDIEASLRQAVIELNAVPIVLDKYGNDIDFLGIDGPIYSKLQTKQAAKNIEEAAKKLTAVFGIVKRNQSSAVLNLLKYAAKTRKTAVLKRILNYQFHNDNSFFSTFLSSGQRSIFFEDRSKREIKAGITADKTRVCCYIKLSNNKIIRLEIPKKIAYMEGDLSMGLDIARKVYLQSNISSKPLPNYFHRADEAAKISSAQINTLRGPIDQYLKKIGDSTVEFDFWKGG